MKNLTSELLTVQTIQRKVFEHPSLAQLKEERERGVAELYVRSVHLVHLLLLMCERVSEAQFTRRHHTSATRKGGKTSPACTGKRSV